MLVGWSVGPKLLRRPNIWTLEYYHPLRFRLGHHAFFLVRSKLPWGTVCLFHYLRSLRSGNSKHVSCNTFKPDHRSKQSRSTHGHGFLYSLGCLPYRSASRWFSSPIEPWKLFACSNVGWHCSDVRRVDTIGRETRQNRLEVVGKDLEPLSWCTEKVSTPANVCHNCPKMAYNGIQP